MKIFFLRLFLLGSMLLSGHALLAQRDMKAFEHGAIALDAGTTGIGLSVAVPLHSSVAVRAGVGALPFSFRYTYNNFDPAPEHFSSTDVLLHAKINMLNGLLLFDYFPSRNSSFFLSAGIYAGQNRMIQISGQSTEPIQIGDLIVTPDEVGRVEGWMKIHAVKPYVGIGFGRTLPESRFGFKFELGALFIGTPTIQSNRLSSLVEVGEEVTGINRFLTRFKVYPKLSFQINYRIF